MDNFLKGYQDSIKKHFQHEKIEIAYLEGGLDHYVFVVNGLHVFRFPRSKDHGVHDDVISNFSQEFASISPIPIQKMTLHIDMETGQKYQAYDFIKGEALIPELAKSLDKDKLLQIAKDLGKFLTVLHSFPIEKARVMQMDSLISSKDYGEYFKDVYELDKKVIGSVLTNEEWIWVKKHLMGFYELTRVHDFPLKVTHSDLLADHILVDETTHELRGIIDFALRIADPANDFKLFDQYGEEFLKTVYDNYPPVDEFFDKRRQFYSNDLPLANLYQAFERKDNRKKQKNLIQKLKEHITTHPID